MSIAEANPNATVKDLATLVLGEFKNNGLWTASTDKDGNVNISKTKITNKQYNTALNMFKSLDSNGFTKGEKQNLDKEQEEYKDKYENGPGY